MSKKVLFFDLDGTLYDLDGKTFRDSRVYSELKERSIEFLCKELKIERDDATKKYDLVAKRYNFLLSQGFEIEFGLPKQEYLNFAWNMNPSRYMRKNSPLKDMLSRLSPTYDMFILSDAPGIWISNVLSYLDIKDNFKGIFSGGDLGIRKKTGLFELALTSLNLKAKNCFMIGDEQITDVEIPKTLGIKPIHISRENGITGIETRL